jgi:hypothetical protein
MNYFGYSSYAARYVTRMLLLVIALLSSLLSSLNNLSSLSNQSQKRDEDVEQLIGTLDEQSKALQNIQGTLESGFESATEHRNENKEEVKEHVTEQLDNFRQEMFAKQAETERKREREHQQLLNAVAAGKKLDFDSNDAPAATGDTHLGKDVVVADEETTTTTEQSSNSSTTLESIAVESLPAAKEEAASLEVKSGVQQASSRSIVDSPLANTKSTTAKEEAASLKDTVEVKVENEAASLEVKDVNATNNSPLPASAIPKKDLNVKVEKKSMIAPRTPALTSTTLATGPTNSTTHANRPPSGLKRRLADTPQSRTRLSEAVSEHIERRKRGRVMDTANSEAKTVNMKLEKSFQIKQTQRVTRSASKKEPPSGSR